MIVLRWRQFQEESTQGNAPRKDANEIEKREKIVRERETEKKSQCVQEYEKQIKRKGNATQC
jgi:hypothetical protein